MSAPAAAPSVIVAATTTTTLVEVKEEKRASPTVISSSSSSTVAATIAMLPAGAVAGGGVGPTRLRRWIINLDQPPAQRWRPMIDTYKHEFQHALTYLTVSQSLATK
jgi:hypothetical protein